MDVNQPPTTERDIEERRRPRLIERVLRTQIPIVDIRLADAVAGPLSVLVAVVVCLPTLALTIAGAYLVGRALGVLGVSEEAQGLLILIVGLGGGLVVSFIVLLRILRHLPTRVRQIAFELDVPPPAAPGPRPPRSAPMSTTELAALDARLAAQPASGGGEGLPEEPQG